jgi:hypothetical protein
MSFMLESLVVVALAGVVFFVFENWLRVWEQRVLALRARLPRGRRSAPGGTGAARIALAGSPVDCPRRRAGRLNPDPTSAELLPNACWRNG